jgi:hypothetical protein
MEPSATWRPVVITVYPETPAPALRCPQCDVSLVYSATALGSREQLERWDRLDCQAHGAFVYQHRTRKLRPDSHGRNCYVHDSPSSQIRTTSATSS